MGSSSRHPHRCWSPEASPCPNSPAAARTVWQSTLQTAAPGPGESCVLAPHARELPGHACLACSRSRSQHSAVHASLPPAGAPASLASWAMLPMPMPRRQSRSREATRSAKCVPARRTRAASSSTAPPGAVSSCLAAAWLLPGCCLSMWRGDAAQLRLCCRLKQPLPVLLLCRGRGRRGAARRRQGRCRLPVECAR